MLKSNRFEKPKQKIFHKWSKGLELRGPGAKPFKMVPPSQTFILTTNLFLIELYMQKDKQIQEINTGEQSTRIIEWSMPNGLI